VILACQVGNRTLVVQTIACHHTDELYPLLCWFCSRDGDTSVKQITVDLSERFWSMRVNSLAHVLRLSSSVKKHVAFGSWFFHHHQVNYTCSIVSVGKKLMDLVD
jgi:hypothetical protein